MRNATSPQESDALLVEFMTLARQVHAAQSGNVSLQLGLFSLTSNKLLQGVQLGYGQADARVGEFLRKNVYAFSGAKTLHQAQELSGLLVDDNGNPRSWRRFRKQALELHQQYNVRWLSAEYEHALASAQMAARWQDYAPETVLRYETVGDSRVRPEHLAWDNVTLPASHPWWRTHYPPNGWNCFTPETEVLTPNGWSRIDSIRVGDLVIGGSGEAKAVEFIHLNHFNQDIVRLVSEKEHVLTTPNHRFLTLKGWIRAENLKVGDILIQLPKIAPVNKVVCYIQHMRALLRNVIVAGPSRAFRIYALNTNTQLRQENINPVGRHVVAELSVIAQRFEMVKHQLLAFRRKYFGVGVSTRVFDMPANTRSGSFSHYFWPAKSRGFLQLKSHFADSWTCFFGFAKPPVPPCSNQIFRDFTHFSARGKPTFSITNPLNLNGLATPSRFYTAVLNQFDKLRRLHTPPLANHAVGEYLPNIQLGEGFTDGQPLQRFNSLNEFIRYAFFHLEFKRVDLIERRPYSGGVHNLSVKDDVSYVTRLGIVHNCRCSVKVAGAGDRITPDVILPALPEPDSIFAGNVGQTGVIFPLEHPYFQTQ